MDQSDLHVAGFERVQRIADAESGLTGFVALHSTARGPAAGGLRMRSYPSEDAARDDVLRLARGMTYKCAMADLPLGGGKAVILGDPARDKTPEMLRAMGRAIERLEGRYWTAEDMGMSPDDMALVAETTAYVAGRAEGRWASGDPSPVTARGIRTAMAMAARHALGTDALGNLTIAVQGLGHVGMALCRLLHADGARLVVADMDQSRRDAARAEFDADVAEGDAIYDAASDIFAPCAVGGVLNTATIPRLRVAAVAGAANNQLAEDADADRLHAMGILYAPDYVANAGGIVNVATEILRIEDRGPWVTARLDALGRSMDEILAAAKAERKSPARVADRIAESKLPAPERA